MNDAPDSTNSENIDVDQLLADIEAPSENYGDIPMGDEPAAEAAAHAEQEFEINYKGQLEKVPLSKFKEYAQQGRDYAQRMGDFNKSQLEFEQRQARLAEREEALKTYAEVDEWAKQNPDKWLAIQDGWQNKGQTQLDPTNPLAPIVQSLQSQIQELSGFRKEILSEREQARIKDEDQKLDATISEVKNQYKDIDFNALDETGITLENRVLKHAAEKGINDFEAAFLQYNKGNLFARAAEKAKEQVGKDLQKSTRAGVVSQSGSKQRQALTPATNVKNKSYDQLAEDALREYGIR